MLFKSQLRNIIPATLITATSAPQTLTSRTTVNLTHRGIRLLATVTGATSGGGTDQLYLCEVNPVTQVVIPLMYFGGANLLSVNGSFAFDFYPQAPEGAYGGQYGSPTTPQVSMVLPLQFAVQAIVGLANISNLQIDGVLLP